MRHPAATPGFEALRYAAIVGPASAGFGKAGDRKPPEVGPTFANPGKEEA